MANLRERAGIIILGICLSGSVSVAVMSRRAVEPSPLTVAKVDSLMREDIRREDSLAKAKELLKDQKARERRLEAERRKDEREARKAAEKEAKESAKADQAYLEATAWSEVDLSLQPQEQQKQYDQILARLKREGAHKRKW